MNRKMYTFICTIVLGLFTIPGLASTSEQSKVVATVNGTIITSNQLLSKVNEKLPLITVHQRISEKRFKEINDQVLDQLIEEELLVQEAERRGLQIKTKELEKQINFMKKMYPSQKQFEKELSKTGMSYQQWVKKIRRRLLIRKLWKIAVTDKVHTNDKDVKEYYLKNKKKFYLPDQLRVAHILITVEPGAMEAGWRAGLAKATDIYKQLVKGADFTRLAKKYSADSTTAANGGDLGWRHVGQLMPELDNVAKTLSVGQISKPVRTIYGYHILKLIGKKQGKQLSFREIDRESLKKRLQKKRIEILGKKFISGLKKQATIRIFSNMGN